MNRSWVRFPQAAQIRPPGSGWAFLYALTGRAAWCARGRRPAREIATREPAARSDRSRGPPWPRRRPRAPQPGPPIPPGPFTPVAPGVLACGLARRLEARPGPAAAHGHRSLAPVPRAPSTPVGPGVLACGLARRLEARPGPAAAHGRCSLVLRTPPNVVWLVVLGSWGAPLCVVTNVVNRRCFSCGFLIRCYKRRQSEGFFAENQGFWTQIDDVCNRGSREVIGIALV